MREGVMLSGREENRFKGVKVDGKQTVRRMKGNGHEESITQSCHKRELLLCPEQTSVGQPSLKSELFWI